MSLIRIALPNKGSLSERASTILTEAGYASRRDSKALSTRDEAGGVEFFFLRPKDIAIYVAGGQLDLGITGRDLALDSGADVEEVMALGFGDSTWMMPECLSTWIECVWISDDIAGGFWRPMLRGTTIFLPPA